MNRRSRLLQRGALALAVCLLAATPARAGQTGAFQRAWAQAKGEPQKKVAALAALARTPSEEAGKLLLRVALSPEEPASVTLAAVGHLAAYCQGPIRAWVEAEAGRAKRAEARTVLVRALATGGGADATPALVRALGDKAWTVRAAAIGGLSTRPSRASVAALIGAFKKLKPKDPASRRLEGDLRDGLYRLTGLDQSDGAGWARWWRERHDSWEPPEAPHALTESESVTTTRIPVLFEEVYSRRVVFVVDVSSSMKIPTGAEPGPETPQGITRFQAMVRELRRIVSALPKKARFNIVAFSDDVISFSPRLVLANPSGKRKALRFIGRLEPKGATNSYRALERAFQDPRVDTVVFLSDGSPTTGKTVAIDEITQAVRGWNLVRQVRVHTIAFLAGDGHPLRIEEGDKSLPKAFMRMLAEANRGRYRLVD